MWTLFRIVMLFIGIGGFGGEVGWGRGIGVEFEFSVGYVGRELFGRYLRGDFKKATYLGFSRRV